ncbi:hypothetical protein [Achromobacter anxifer]|uniref:hypothetical protein n=1 Tax=Achromobacter anxifer TaxID=1287737 RepID=UPI0023F64E4E|nr:hypothetical protein [Achromobacter anxifer]MDF8364727.1 hypothetical protein [Achromobacter anxifer]
MRQQENGTTIIDGHKWMRSLRIPMWALAQIRKLRVGESYLIGHFHGPSGIPNHVGTASAEITREPGKGNYRFGAIWLISFGRRQHAHIFTTGHFILRPGREILFEPQDMKHERGFQQVCRQIMLVINNRQAFGVEDSYRSYETSPHRLYHALWRGQVIGRDGFTAAGIPGPNNGGPTVVIQPSAEDVLA